MNITRPTAGVIEKHRHFQYDQSKLTTFELTYDKNEQTTVSC